MCIPRLLLMSVVAVATSGCQALPGSPAIDGTEQLRESASDEPVCPEGMTARSAGGAAYECLPTSLPAELR